MCVSQGYENDQVAYALNASTSGAPLAVAADISELLPPEDEQVFLCRDCVVTCCGSNIVVCGLLKMSSP